MSGRFVQHLKRVTVVHIAIVLLISVASWMKAHVGRRPEMSMPIEFVVEVPSAPAQAADPVDLREVAPPKPKPKTDPAPKPKRKKKKIKISQNVVSRDGSKRQSQSKLTPEEIKRLLAMGAKPSDHTNIPSEDARCLAIIRNRLFSMWSQPSYAEVADATTEVTLKLGPGGAVKSGSLTKRSGNAVLDASIQKVVDNIRKIEGITPSFISRHGEVTISFRVQP